MGMRVKDEGGEPRELVPARTYLAVISHVIDLGTQHSEQYGSDDRKISIGWELHTQKGPALSAKGHQYTTSKDFTLKFSKIKNKTPAALRVAVEQILNREFTQDEAREGYDVEQLVGKCCKVQIKHETPDGKTYDSIGAITPLDEDDRKPEPQLDSTYYEVDPSREIPAEVPKWIARKIKRSREWVQVHGEPSDDRKPALATASNTREPGDDGFEPPY